MMGEPTKSFASLSPRLLARKGGAKPAMRPQVQPLTDFQLDLTPATQDDLGWNDMGEDAEGSFDHDPSIEAQDRAETVAEVVSITGASAPQEAHLPEIVAQQQDIAARMKRRSATPLGLGQRRAAFTLRIDPERHMQLRLASTVSGRSAQSLLTEALDRMIDEMPEIRAMAETVRKRS